MCCFFLDSCFCITLWKTLRFLNEQSTLQGRFAMSVTYRCWPTFPPWHIWVHALRRSQSKSMPMTLAHKPLLPQLHSLTNWSTVQALCHRWHGRGNRQLKAFSGILKVFKQQLFSVCLDKQTAGKHWFRVNRGTGSSIPTIVHFCADVISCWGWGHASHHEVTWEPSTPHWV